MRKSLALSVFFVLLEGVSNGAAVTFKPVPVRASSLGRLLLSKGAARLVVEMVDDMDDKGPTSPTPESASEME